MALDQVDIESLEEIGARRDKKLEKIVNRLEQIELRLTEMTILWRSDNAMRRCEHLDEGQLQNEGGKITCLGCKTTNEDIEFPEE
jgi:hypothetical protein